MQGWVNPSFDSFDISEVASSPPKKKQSKLSAFPSTSRKKFSGKHSFQKGGSGGSTSKVQSSWKRNVEDNVPWSEKHTPSTLVELAVHKKKIAEVEDWLKRHLSKKHPSYQNDSFILLLTGPAGVGKTATVNTLAKELKLTIQEWLNPTTDIFQKDDFFNNIDYSSYPKYMSQVAKFEEFLLRANRYQPLQLGQKTETNNKLILVEDLPNKFYRDSQTFHSILRRFSKTTRCPAVFIVSDTYSTEINVQSLFPKDVVASLGIHQISFNPVAPTSMSKTLTRIAAAESSKGRHRFPMPSKSTIDAIAQVSNGDIRSAINALQFACLKDTGDLEDVLESRVESKSKKNKKSGKCQKKDSTNQSESGKALSAIGGKDTSLFLFRAIGKILYCKRELKHASDAVLPSHLSHHERDRLIINPEEVVERTHMTSENFTLYLHQNYLEFFDDIDDCMEVADHFSVADHMSCDWEHRSILNQYSSSVATRGLIHYNTARSFHNSANTAGGGGWRPLHKPEWFEISRKYRDRCATAKALFVGDCWTPVDLQTQILPYLAVSNVPLRNPAQISFLQEVGHMSLQHFHQGHLGQRLDEKDLDEDEEFEDSIPSSQTRQNLKKPEVVSEQADALSGKEEDTFVIEDFDD